MSLSATCEAEPKSQSFRMVLDSFTFLTDKNNLAGYMGRCHFQYSRNVRCILTIPGCCLAWCQHGGCCNVWAASEPRRAVGCKTAQLWCGVQHLCRISSAPLVNSYYRRDTNSRGQINATIITCQKTVILSTSEAQTRDKDAACGRSVGRGEGSGTCRQGRHRSASWGILTLSNPSSACLSQTHAAIRNEKDTFKYVA